MNMKSKDVVHITINGLHSREMHIEHISSKSRYSKLDDINDIMY